MIQQITMLPIKGVPDGELALELVMDALRQKSEMPPATGRARPATPDWMESVRKRRAARAAVRP